MQKNKQLWKKVILSASILALVGNTAAYSVTATRVVPNEILSHTLWNKVVTDLENLITQSNGNVTAVTNLGAGVKFVDGTLNTADAVFTSGNVGIGTTSPTARLEISGTGGHSRFVNSNTSGSDTGIVIVGARNNAAGGNTAFLDFSDYDSDEGTGTEFQMGRIAGGMNEVSGTTGFLHFMTNNGSGLVENMRINKDGNVGIGILNPSHKLDIAGNIKVSGSIRNAGDQVIRDPNGGWIRTYGDTGWYNGTYGGGWRMTDTTWMRTYNNKSVYTAGNMLAGGNMSATAFMYSSDKSLKENISTIETPLEKVQNLNGVDFNWKKDGKKSIGFIAQDVEKVLPELVHTNPETGLKAVEYGNITALLVEAVKELKKENEVLRAEINALK